MSVELGDDATPLTSVRQAVEWMEAGCRPRAQWRIGTEHEKFPFYADSLKPVPYEGPNGIHALLVALQQRLSWEPITQDGALIGLRDPHTSAAISLEPGGQFELSGAPLSTLHDTATEIDEHMKAAKAEAAKLGIAFLGLGFNPLHALADIPRMPKRRYDLMTAYMPKVGTRGLDMMYRTCTVQVNLDYDREATMVQMLRVALALQPIATALFAASPLCEGQLSGFKSLRSECWRATDTARAGMIPFAFEPGMSFARYVEWALDVPLYFVKRGDVYHEGRGYPFRALLEGRLPHLPGERAIMSDWTNHLSTLFPEVRLKRFMEMRGADSGPLAHMPALSALWVGLLYDDAARDQAAMLVKDWDVASILHLRDEVPRLGLQTVMRGRSAGEIARDVLAIAAQGLEIRRNTNTAGEDESRYLTPLMDIAARETTLADQLIADYAQDPTKSSAIPARSVFETYRL